MWRRAVIGNGAVCYAVRPVGRVGSSPTVSALMIHDAQRAADFPVESRIRRGSRSDTKIFTSCFSPYPTLTWRVSSALGAANLMENTIW